MRSYPTLLFLALAAAQTPSGSGGSSSSPLTGPCPSEGMWNCVDGSSFQRCASGSWSSPIPVAAGTTCAKGTGASSDGSLAGACKPDGLWNCINGTAFQRCASGSWSTPISMASGTTCTPEGSSPLFSSVANQTKPTQIASQIASLATDLATQAQFISIVEFLETDAAMTTTDPLALALDLVTATGTPSWLTALPSTVESYIYALASEEANIYAEDNAQTSSGAAGTVAGTGVGIASITGTSATIATPSVKPSSSGAATGKTTWCCGVLVAAASIAILLL